MATQHGIADADSEDGEGDGAPVSPAPAPPTGPPVPPHRFDPPAARRRFVPRADFAAASRGAASVDIDAFRADQDAAFDQKPRTLPVPPTTSLAERI